MISHKTMRAIWNKFGKDIEIVEARSPLRLHPIPADADGAQPKCPDDCLFVHTAARMFGSRGAIFWKKYAYVDLVGTDGVRRVERFVVPTATTRQMGDFDNGVPLKEGASFLLMPPTPGRTLRADRRNKARYRRENKAKSQASEHLAKAKVSLRHAEIAFDNARVVAAEVRKICPPLSKKRKYAEQQLNAEKVRVHKCREKLEEKEKIAKAILSDTHRRMPRAKPVFDLVTRNGAKGNYRFSGSP